MALVEIKFAPWSSKASLNIEVGDDVEPRFRLRAAVEIVVGEARDGKRSGAVLSYADLSDAVLSDADLSGAVLRGAVLSYADLSGAVLRGAVLSDVPKIENIDAKILAALEAGGNLNMRAWQTGSAS